MTDQPASLAEALAILQTRLPRIGKDQTATIPTKNGGAYGYKYADLATISREILPLLGDLGLSFSCAPTVVGGGGFVLDYRLLHVSGDELTGSYPLPQGAPQAIGSAITYARRYCLCAITGAVADEDDDAADAQAEYQPPRYKSAHADPEHQRLVHGSDERIMDQGRAIHRTGPDDESRSWETEPPPTDPGSIPALQRTLMFLSMEFSRLGINDRADKLQECSRWVGRKLESTKDMSEAEAQDALAKVKAIPTPEWEEGSDGADADA